MTALKVRTISRDILSPHSIRDSMSEKQSHQELDVVIIGSGMLYLPPLDYCDC